MSELLVVAGEASGDRAAAQVVSELSGLGLANVRVFGMGGSSLEAQGVELVSDLRASTALGVTDVAARACAIGVAYAAVARAARKRKATRGAPRQLHRVQHGPRRPAPRARRARALVRRAADLGVAARAERVRSAGPWIAWPSCSRSKRRSGASGVSTRTTSGTRRARRRSLDSYRGPRSARPDAVRAAPSRILPGSRPHEVKRLLGPMLEAYERVRHDRASIDGRVLLAPSLDEATRARALEAAQQARRRGRRGGRAGSERRRVCARSTPRCARRGPRRSRRRSRAPCRSSSTASVSLTELAARGSSAPRRSPCRTCCSGGPRFAELLQREVQPEAASPRPSRARSTRATLSSERATRCDAGARRRGERPSRDVARMLRPWLGVTARAHDATSERTRDRDARWRSLSGREHRPPRGPPLRRRACRLRRLRGALRVLRASPAAGVPRSPRAHRRRRARHRPGDRALDASSRAPRARPSSRRLLPWLRRARRARSRGPRWRAAARRGARGRRVRRRSPWGFSR